MACGLNGPAVLNHELGQKGFTGNYFKGSMGRGNSCKRGDVCVFIFTSNSNIFETLKAQMRFVRRCSNVHLHSSDKFMSLRIKRGMFVYSFIPFILFSSIM